jgi:hypothetical protein
MRSHLIVVIGACASVVCFPAIAQRTPTPVVARNICPAGTSTGQCLDNAIAAINDLERRVATLEAQAGNSQSPSSSRQCPAGTVASPLGCRPPNAP